MHLESVPAEDEFGVAVIGMAGRFPLADSLDAFWQNSLAGRDSITTFSQEELRAAGVKEDLLSHPGAVFRHGVLADYKAFDAPFFGFTARDAVFLNPQHRILLEAVYIALENAGLAHLAGSRDRPNVGVFVLRRLDDARAQNDPIAAVVLGSFINNDGSEKAGFTAPSVQGQVEVVKTALRYASVAPAEVGLLEAHGTGTLLGDPIEFRALCEAFEGGEPGSVAIGSVKANIGHLDAAAGIAGFIKAVLSIKHKAIAPLANFTAPNPACAFDGSPFFVPTKDTAWRPDRSRRIACVSSFGIGGTNAHVVLAGADVPEAAANPVSWPRLALFSAKDPDAVESHTADALSGWNVGLSAAATSWLARRPALPARAFAVIPGPLDTPLALSDSLKPTPAAQIQSADVLAFVFPGQGTLGWPDIDALLAAEGPLKSALTTNIALLAGVTGRDIQALLVDQDIRQNPVPLAGLGLEQALTASVQLAVADYLAHVGVKPGLLIGHSVGEYAAAVLAGVMPKEQAFLLLAERGRLCATLPAGAMATVIPSADFDLADWQAKGLSLAAVNSAELLTLSGPATLIDELREWARKSRMFFKRLPVSKAFHSEMTEDIRGAFEAFAAQFSFKAPALPIHSTVTGQPVDAGTLSPAYWGRHLRQTVLFADAADSLLSRATARIVMEIGPGAGLAQLIASNPRALGSAAPIASPRSHRAPSTAPTSN